jgi:2-dehydro-3-deoxyglucarate aldolase/4-hydroxy-2-oxoheptanedioate aldolase
MTTKSQGSEYETKGFRETINAGGIALGPGISFTDPAVTEALSGLVDYVWLEMEHAPLSLDHLAGHFMATKGTGTTPIVRVPWNDPVIIKRVLDTGAAGIIAPMVRNSEEARQLVSACLYPPDGTRGYGPRRQSGYGRRGGADFCRQSNEDMIVIAQMEHIEAVNCIDEILAVPGLTSIVLGPQDLAGSMGHTGEPTHPEVIEAIEHIIKRAQSAGVWVGGSSGGPLDELDRWVDRGINWMQLSNDFRLMMMATRDLAGHVRERCASRG